MILLTRVNDIISSIIGNSSIGVHAETYRHAQTHYVRHTTLHYTTLWCAALTGACTVHTVM